MKRLLVAVSILWLPTLGLAQDAVPATTPAPAADVNAVPATEVTAPVQPVAAEDPQTNQNPDGGRRRGGGFGGGPGFGGSGGMGGANRPFWMRRPDGTGPMDGPSDDEWNQAVDFLKTNSPNRLAVFNQLPDGPVKFRLRRFVFSLYQGFDQIQKRDPELADATANRIHLQDDIFGLAPKVQQANSQEQEKVKADLKEKIAQLVDANQKERQIRIDRLHKTLADEEKKLADDKARKAEIVGERYQHALKNPQALMGDRGEGGGPPHGGPPRGGPPPQ